MARGTDYDQEKTQVPEPMELREMRLKQAAWEVSHGCGTVGCEMTQAQKLTELFSYHPPTSETLPKFAAINQAAKNFAEVVLQNCPQSVDRSAAIRLIRDARMTANAAVALNGLSL